MKNINGTTHSSFIQESRMSKLEIINLGFILLSFIFFVFVCSIQGQVKMQIQSTFSLNELLYGMPAYFLLTFPTLFAFIIPTYAISNLMSFYLLGKKNIQLSSLTKKAIYALTLLLWVVFNALILQVILKDFFLLPSPFSLNYAVHGSLYNVIDVCFATLLGIGSSLSILSIKNAK